MNEEPSAPFGELLATFRARRRLTQMALAVAMGAHRNTIGRWERGDGLPETRGIVVELARQLRLNEQETRLLLEASLTGPAPYWTVPFWRNPRFAGRDTILQRLHALLAPTQPSARDETSIRTVALTGLGGIGKTQLATEYAYRFALDYCAVLWLAAATPDSIATSVQQIATQLRLPERQAGDQGQMLRAVQGWLSVHAGWLVIADELDDLALLHETLPTIRRGSLLLTTRCQALGALTDLVEVPPLRLEEGVTFLLTRSRRFGRPPAKAEMDAAIALVQELEGLPLALDQARAYIEETACSVADYLQRIRSHRRRLLARRGPTGEAHPVSVTHTLLLSVERIERTYPPAADLLRLCVFLHPQAIPEELLIAGLAELDSKARRQRHAHPTFDAFNEAVAALRHASLLTRHPEARTCSVHRLVQAALRDQMTPTTVHVWCDRVIHLLLAAFPAGEVADWSLCGRLLPHILACAQLLTDQQCNQEVITLLRRAGTYLSQRAQYQQATSVFERVLHIQKQVLVANDSEIATSLYQLALLAREQGRNDDAQALLQQALDLCEKALGPHHLEAARIMTGLAILATDRGQDTLAESLYERALSLWEQAPKPRQPEVGCALNGLAILRKNQGKLEQARRLYKRALRSHKRSFGATHPKVAMVLNNLAATYQAQGKLDQAKPLYEQALQIWDQTVGPTHPDVAYGLNNLGEIACAQQQYVEAKAYSWRALHIWKQVVGLDHALIAHPLHNLAAIAQAQGKADRAEALYKRALRIREQCLEPSHPAIALTLQDLATFYRQQGQYEQARALFQRALTIEEHRLGSAHSRTVTIRRAFREVCELASSENTAPGAKSASMRGPATRIPGKPPASLYHL